MGNASACSHKRGESLSCALFADSTHLCPCLPSETNLCSSRLIVKIGQQVAPPASFSLGRLLLLLLPSLLSNVNSPSVQKSRVHMIERERERGLNCASQLPSLSSLTTLFNFPNDCMCLRKLQLYLLHRQTWQPSTQLPIGPPEPKVWRCYAISFSHQHPAPPPLSFIASFNIHPSSTHLLSSF